MFYCWALALEAFSIYVCINMFKWEKRKGKKIERNKMFTISLINNIFLTIACIIYICSILLIGVSMAIRCVRIVSGSPKIKQRHWLNKAPWHTQLTVSVRSRWESKRSFLFQPCKWDKPKNFSQKENHENK